MHRLLHLHNFDYIRPLLGFLNVDTRFLWRLDIWYFASEKDDKYQVLLTVFLKKSAIT